MFVCLLVASWNVALLCRKGIEHADERHPEALGIRIEVSKLIDTHDRSARAEQFQVCWSPLWGNLMISYNRGIYECAVIYKIFMIHDGVLEPTIIEPRERTAFCKTGQYWDRVRRRDLYICLTHGDGVYNKFLNLVK